MTTKILYIAYQDIPFAARSQQFVRILDNLGELVVASYSPAFSKGIRAVTLAKGRRRLFAFLADAVKLLAVERPDVVCIRDVHTAPLIRLIKVLLPHAKVVYDAAELNLGSRPHGWKSQLFVPFKKAEAKFLKRADVVIAANRERAEIMRWAYQLQEVPMVVENVHRLDGQYVVEELDKKFAEVLTSSDFTAFHSGGIGRDRLAYELADAFGRLGSGYRLVVAGKYTSEQLKDFELHLTRRRIQNVYVAGNVTHSELRYLIQRSDICVSTYRESSLNTRYCASGKIYEGMFEGKPILASSNPPLKRLCESHGVGVSTLDFEAGMRKLQSEYGAFVRAVEEYITGLDPETASWHQSCELRRRLSRV